MSTIGKSIPRKEGRKKVTGQALYVDDLNFPDMLHGVTVRSPTARGTIKNISFAGDLPWDEFVVVTAKDIPGANHVAYVSGIVTVELAVENAIASASRVPRSRRAGRTQDANRTRVR